MSSCKRVGGASVGQVKEFWGSGPEKEKINHYFTDMHLEFNIFFVNVSVNSPSI